MIRILELREDDRWVRGYVAYDTRANQLLSDRLSSVDEAEAYIGWFERVGAGLPLVERMPAWRTTREAVMV